MSFTSNDAIRLVDSDGESIDDTAGRLKVTIDNEELNVDIGDVEIKGHDAIGHGGNNAIGLTAEQITVSSTPCKHVDIMAAIGNTGFIAIGTEDVNEAYAAGIWLYAGDVYSIDIDNVNKIYAIAQVDGEDVHWTYYN